MSIPFILSEILFCGGMSIEDVLDDFPDLTLEDIQACFAFAADRDRHNHDYSR